MNPAALGTEHALARLGSTRRIGRVVHVQQMTSSDCGAACLAMVLALYGRFVRLAELRHGMQGGVDALAVLQAARRHGLRGRGVRVEPALLHTLPRGAILHWEFNHFVVLDGVHRDAITIVDPACGRRRIPIARFVEAFTGVALLCEPGEAFAPAGRPARATAGLLRRLLAHRGLWRRIVTQSAMVQLLALGLPLATSVLVDRVLPRHDAPLLWVLAGGLAVMAAFHFVASWIRVNLLVQLRTVLDAEWTVDFVEHLLALPLSFFHSRSTGDLMMRLASNATVREILTSSALSAVLDGTMVLTYWLVIVAISPWLGATVAALACAQLLLFVTVRRRQRELMAEGLAAHARTSSFEVEMLGGIETLKSMGAEHRALERWSNRFVDHLNVALVRAQLDALVGALRDALAIASPLVVLGTGAALVLRGELGLGTMLGLAALSAGFLGPVAALVDAGFKLQLLGSYLERIDDVLGTATEAHGKLGAQVHDPSGAISLHGVGYRYEQAHAPALVDVDLEVPAGRFVAIVGPSGAGKSTLAKLLLGLFPAASGRVCYDGMDLRTLDLVALRGRIGVVPQQPTLFALSVRENIALAHPEAPLERVIAAARAAAIHDEILALPMGYETLLADGGASLSGGQRQRLALARALLGEPAVLVLDEATSALDAITEQAVQHALAHLRCTRVVVAHRLSTVMHADTIVVMEAGRIVATGTHAELLAQDGTYRRLYRRQLVHDPEAA